MPEVFFRSTEELYAALRFCDDPDAWRRAADLWALRDGDQRAWLLRAEPLPGVPGTPARSDGERVLAGEREWRVVERRARPTLVETVPLAPEPSRPSAAVYAVMPGPSFRDAARDVLMLGNDRMRYLPLGDGRILLLIEELNEFLRARWAESEDIALYRPAEAEPRVLLPWGFGYPLADKLHFVGADEHQLWLADDEAPWRRLNGPPADIYERIQVDPGGLERRELPAADEVPTITVALRLEPSEEAARPQLWWLAEGDRPALEQLVREASEAELNNLQVAAVSDAGRPAWLVAERLGIGGQLTPPVHGGRAYVARLPVEHLYLPVGLRLAPLLSRRSLVEALGLGEDHLTLLDVAPAGGLRVQRVPRSALRPLSDLALYDAGAAADEVEALRQQVVFDFGLDLPVVEEPGEQPPAPERAGLWASFMKWLGQ